MSTHLANLVAAFIFIIFGIWFLINGIALPGAMNNADIGPAVFPVLLSVLIIIFSIVLIVQTFKNLKNGSNGRITINRIFNVVCFAGLMVLYAALLPRIGYYISTAIFFPLLILASGEKSWKKVVFITVGFIAFASVAFDILLGVPLP